MIIERLKGRGLSALWYAFYFSVVSAFHLGWRDLNVGTWIARLHHLALKVASSDELNAVFSIVKNWPGIEIEFSPEFSGKGPKEHFIILEPGGTRLEVSFDPR
ncbi:hypothetical protein [Pelagibius sp. Alg239-R121]|uniref:hypothetical protein n=1 Tax=Pelagibius sp. Alg239-R121 TaxID=2993448 RepID=UPI0024A73FC4|nr:hypothetical protein [Pelagibius sp. Alg239-R121]